MDPKDAIKRLTTKGIRWSRVADGLQLYVATHISERWSIREGKKGEPRFSLYIDGLPIISFDAWPKAWGREPRDPAQS